MRLQFKKHPIAFVAMSFFVVACVLQTDPGSAERYRWWTGLGPVLPHDTFPADCTLCHIGDSWDTLRDSFEFDHKKETGVALIGAHQQARCLRCHNDRGPVGIFNAKGCVGCHEDYHYGELGPACDSCHTQKTWQAVGQRELHNRTRFPLTGAHAPVACHRCHTGALVGNFVPTDTNCVTCHADDRDATQFPNHNNLGWIDNCHRCHFPTVWNQAHVNPAFSRTLGPGTGR